MIAYLGPEGSYSHICAQQIAAVIDTDLLMAFQSISEIYTAVAEDKAQFGLLPLENSLGGSVPETLDNLVLGKAETDLQVRLEWVLPVEHYLIGFSENVNEIRAHFQAFTQCDKFLKTYYPQVVRKEMSSNSAAALSLLAESAGKAAICSKEAARLYKIPILHEKINDFPHNFTRFWLIAKKELKLKNAHHLVSIAFRIPQDLPGSLVKVLKPISERNINLSKIESRPTKGRLCEYTFYLDLVNSGAVDELLIEELKSICSYFKFLGDYPVWPLNALRFS